LVDILNSFFEQQNIFLHSTTINIFSKSIIYLGTIRTEDAPCFIHRQSSQTLSVDIDYFISKSESAITTKKTINYHSNCLAFKTLPLVFQSHNSAEYFKNTLSLFSNRHRLVNHISNKLIFDYPLDKNQLVQIIFKEHFVSTVGNQMNVIESYDDFPLGNKVR